MYRKVNKIVEINKYKFFEFYYYELDKFLLEYNSEEIIKTINEEFQLYYSSDEDVKGQLDITVRKEPSKKIKSIVHQVFDNASRIPFQNVEKLIIHLDKHFKFLIFLKKTNTDIFQLFSARRINNLFIVAQKYKVNLFYNFNKSGVLSELFSLIKESNISLVASMLECLLQTTYSDMINIRNYEYDKYIPVSSSQDSNTSTSSSCGNIGSSSFVGSYGSGKGIPIPTPHYSQQVNYSSPPRHNSPLSCKSSIIQKPDKPPIYTLTLLNKECQNFYDIIITFIFTNYSKCLIWMPREIYNTSLHLLNINMELKKTTNSLIIDTLQYFTKSTSLYNPNDLEWNINLYLQKSIHNMKKSILFPSQNSGSPTNNKKRSNLHWIFPLADKLEISIMTNIMNNKQYIEPSINSSITKNQLLIIDGRNWFYNKDYSKYNYININELQKYKKSSDFVKNVFNKIQYHFDNVLKTHITQNYSSIVKCIFVFNEYHHRVISQYNPDMLNMCVFTPEQQNSNNDDIFCLYLWLSNPGSFLLSNDQYRIYADKLMGHQYYLGLWKHWTNCFQIHK